MPDSLTAGRVPPVAVSTTSTLVTKTGAWKYIQPVYRDRVAPCNEACPVGIDVEGYLNLIREGRTAQALDLLLRENPMPAITGRVCHHPCEASCNRRCFDEAVAVHEIERSMGDLALETTPRRMPGTRVGKIGIVGSGPAALSCAYHLARLGYAVIVHEAAAEPGGMLRLGIPEYRLPRVVLNRQIEWIAAHGVEFVCGVRVGTDIPWRDFLSRFDAVFVAIGAMRSRPLGIPGEQLEGVRPGLEFLAEVNRGERPKLGARVVVVGGGNTAMDCARTAVRLGSDVTVLYRRTRAEMPAIAAEVEEAEREGVRFTFLVAPALLRGTDRVKSVECQLMRLGEPDASGRRAPVPIEGSRFRLPADTVLTAIGELPDFRSLPTGMDLDQSGVATDQLGATSLAAVFAGGDLTRDPRSVAHAIGAGKRAAIGIDRHLLRAGGLAVNGGDPDELRYGPRGNLSITRWRGDDPVSRHAPLNEVVTFGDINTSQFVHRPRAIGQRVAVEIARAGFDEVNVGLSQDEAYEEAGRCFNCAVCNRCDLCLILCPDIAITRDGDGYAVNLDYCKGCGVCAAECPRGAITMTKVGE
ncbi:MAG TPA: NAD(P)-binding protein [Gemmatimonadales bacterium]|nr:NAD(P)-binding protein [Gemmatimonadales bacterium]